MTWPLATDRSHNDEADDEDAHDSDHNLGHALLNDIQSSWIGHLLRRVDTAHADDDEFDNETLDGTTLTVSGSATWVEKLSRASVVFSNQTSEDFSAQIYALTPTAAPVTIETVVSGVGQRSNHMMVALGFSDGDEAADGRVACYLYQDENGVIRWNGTDGTFTAHANSTFAVILNADLVDRLYMRMIWAAANTFEAYLSSDGITWSRFGGTDQTPTLTPTHFWVGVSTWGSAEARQATFEYLRVSETDMGTDPAIGS